MGLQFTTECGMATMPKSEMKHFKVSIEQNWAGNL